MTIKSVFILTSLMDFGFLPLPAQELLASVVSVVPAVPSVVGFRDAPKGRCRLLEDFQSLFVTAPSAVTRKSRQNSEMHIDTSALV